MNTPAAPTVGEVDPLRGLQPRPVWRHFAELAARPRPSGQEEAVRQYVRGWATGLGLELAY